MTTMKMKHDMNILQTENVRRSVGRYAFRVNQPHSCIFLKPADRRSSSSPQLDRDARKRNSNVDFLTCKEQKKSCIRKISTHALKRNKFTGRIGISMYVITS